MYTLRGAEQISNESVSEAKKEKIKEKEEKEMSCWLTETSQAGYAPGHSQGDKKYS